jgi:hypothetical protein
MEVEIDTDGRTHTHTHTHTKGDDEFSSATSFPFNGGLSLGLYSSIVLSEGK